ncbi:hypothetical protein, partial [Gemmatimonas sp.]
MADWMSDRAARFTADGEFVHPEFNVMILDSITVPSFANAPRSTAHVQIDAHSGWMLRGWNHVPFAPIPVFDITPRRTLRLG